MAKRGFEWSMSDDRIQGHGRKVPFRRSLQHDS